MKRIIILISLICLVGCSKKKSAAPAISPPEKALLSFPAQNEACTTGTVVSSTESTIQFAWGSSSNTDSYELTVKNLSDNSITLKTSNTNSTEITLKRNTPYSWYVTSKSSKTTTTAQSDTWKFYNSGPGTLSYAPYPADILTPSMNQNVSANAGKISLDWNGADADNDITAYDVYFGTSNTPGLFQSNLTASILSDVSVSSNTTYYWKIITKDSKGNTSDTGIYQFRVN